MKTLMNTWCTSARGTFGISVLENQDGDLELRGSSVSGLDEKFDLKTIEDWGGSVSINDLERMINFIKEKRNK